MPVRSTRTENNTLHTRGHLDAELAMEGNYESSLSIANAKTLPGRAQTERLSMFNLRSTGKPLPWMIEQLRGMEIKDEGQCESEDHGPTIESDVTPRVATTRDTFEKWNERSVTVSSSCDSNVSSSLRSVSLED